MKISITTNNKVYSVEDELGFDCVGIDEAVEMFRGLLVCAGFHPSNVDNQFNLDYAWFTQEESEDAEASKEMQKRIEEWQSNLYKP